MKKIRSGFTLAEVLITLLIIGIVALMTIPNLLQKKREKETIVAVKKAYTVLSDAYTLAVRENGSPETWDVEAASNALSNLKVAEIFAKHLKVQKFCGLSSGCFTPSYRYQWFFKTTQGHFLDAPWYTGAANAQLADGTSISFSYFNAATSRCESYRGEPKIARQVCGDIIVDVNGFKPPNRIGEDTFYFQYSRVGLYPYGIKGANSNNRFEESCNLDNTNATGSSCTAWVVYNENMDFLRCGGLSWDGKQRCD